MWSWPVNVLMSTRHIRTYTRLIEMHTRHRETHRDTHSAQRHAHYVEEGTQTWSRRRRQRHDIFLKYWWRDTPWRQTKSTGKSSFLNLHFLFFLSVCVPCMYMHVCMYLSVCMLSFLQIYKMRAYRYFYIWCVMISHLDHLCKSTATSLATTASPLLSVLLLLLSTTSATTACAPTANILTRYAILHYTILDYTILLYSYSSLSYSTTLLYSTLLLAVPILLRTYTRLHSTISTVFSMLYCTILTLLHYTRLDYSWLYNKYTRLYHPRLEQDFILYYT